MRCMAALLLPEAAPQLADAAPDPDNSDGRSKMEDGASLGVRADS